MNMWGCGAVMVVQPHLEHRAGVVYVRRWDFWMTHFAAMSHHHFSYRLQQVLAARETFLSGKFQR